MRAAVLLVLFLLLWIPLQTNAAETAHEDDDVYYIDAERLPVLIERAQLATDVLVGREGEWADWLEASLEVYGASPPLAESHAIRADRALKEAALNLLLLRNRVVIHGLLPADTLAEVIWPAWAMQAPGAAPPPEVANNRIEWLAPLVYEITSKVCSLAQKKINNDLICSVE